MRETILSRLWLAGQRVLRDSAAPPVCDDLALEQHQAAALDWLCRAQEISADGGVSAGFHLKHGWLPSYPETTGYIACTFFDQADAQARADLERRAWRMIDWLMTLQLESGGFAGQFGSRARGPIVFNTGQILFGLVRAAERDRSRHGLREAAVRAASWLVDVMDSDGGWHRHTHQNVVHSYNSRTAWALLRCWRLCGDRLLRDAALRNFNWVLRGQRPDGFLAHAGFRPDSPPYLHTIAYAIRGLLEGGLLLQRDELIESARLAAQALAERIVAEKSLAGAYDEGWRPAAKYRCLTGEAQMTIIWARLFEHTGHEPLLDACRVALRHLAATQVTQGPPAVRGAIAGSHPIWGRYSRFEFPNWAAKFFVDAVSSYRQAVARAALREEVQCV